ncbi:MAG: 16S rRNA (adenine(1518)-N(6)/adenine(1519)-N(6))-dimethyltransferase RsmA [Clostridiales Family XIII bacterium]|jgi:16S rRNA (adenine1518-N6/adenine1519-N6)-dimethyltransferase|nr:16S rRNA (adenine(1518)-N(6)/adenine(1519)-N(6))-dimethyltransferase RsmA [Clostridiales Family XIII bacterium]
MKPHSLRTIRDLCNVHDFTLAKSLGQNFLTDIHIIEKIADALLITEGELVYEIGPGMGALTMALADAGANLKAIEVDRRLIPILEQIFYDYDNVEIIESDVLKFQFPDEDYKLIGNLPYYITTPIIMDALERPRPPKSMVFMMQKEVADRILSPPGSKVYGALSVMVQYRCDVDHVTDVSPDVFFPKPKVSSSVLRFNPRPESEVITKHRALFSKVVHAAFAQRRKTVANSLKTLQMSDGTLSSEQIRTALHAAGIDPIRRAETMSVEEFSALTDAFFEIS